MLEANFPIILLLCSQDYSGLVGIILTHFSIIFDFYTPWKRQKGFRTNFWNARGWKSQFVYLKVLFKSRQFNNNSKCNNTSKWLIFYKFSVSLYTSMNDNNQFFGLFFKKMSLFFFCFDFIRSLFFMVNFQLFRPCLLLLESWFSLFFSFCPIFSIRKCNCKMYLVLNVAVHIIYNSR